MTVNELFSVWLHNKNPYVIINVWDRSIGDYISKIRIQTREKRIAF